MRLLIYADPHWSQYSSIVRKRGVEFSVRLENLINSLNWVVETAESHRCAGVVCLGDFFDKSDLNAEEITALGRIDWGTIPHFFLVGNHEMGSNDRLMSSTNIFNLLKGEVKSEVEFVEMGDVTLGFIPYILESNRKKEFERLGGECLSDIVPKNKRVILFSHNDLQIQYGEYKSTVGFTVEDIENSCDLFINGHLHNGEKVTDKIINLGNLTGQNFSEDARKYVHNVMILDTDTLKYELIPNPWALNFYKVEFGSIISGEYNIKLLPANSVVSIKCNECYYQDVLNIVEESKKIIAYRITVVRDAVEHTDEATLISVDDHLKQFNDYIKETVGSSDLVLSELYEVCK